MSQCAYSTPPSAHQPEKALRIPHSLRASILAAVAALALAASAFAAEKLPFVSPIFGDHMVLQRGKTNTIWGWTKPGETVRVTFADKTATAVAQADGRWTAQIDPPAVGGPRALLIEGSQRVELQDVLVGDVWLCGGQSNMEFPLSGARDGDKEIQESSHPNIRFFTVAQRVAYAPVALSQGAWSVCSPASSRRLSAVAYFFGRKLEQDLNVPIGLVVDAVGGTPAESWTSAQSLRALKDFDAGLDEIARLAAKDAPPYGNYIMHWYDEYDPGIQSNAWFRPELDDSSWKTVAIPGGFQELGVPESPAVCYFRKTVVLPDPVPAGAARILLGIVQRMETTWVNGRQVGASAWVENPRNYPIPAGVLKPGSNNVTLRVLKTKPDGGFMSKPGDLKLVLGDGKEIPLAGEWKGKLSVDARSPHSLPVGYENWPVMPSVLHTGMIAPIAPLALTGALWYQGEANTERAAQYRTLLPAMIADWRKTFGQGDFPFYIASLAAFQPRKDVPESDSWAELRGAQDFVAHSVTNSGLALAIDIGDADNIHPKDKKEVGERLALIALAKNYGKTIPYSGPRLESVSRESGALIIHFTHIEGGLVAKGGKLEEFSVRGEDGKWHWAYARIFGDTVIVSTSEAQNPAAVRYAWQSNPKATLYNGAGLPAIPFEAEAPAARMR